MFRALTNFQTWLMLLVISQMEPSCLGTAEIKSTLRIASDLGTRFLMKLADTGKYTRYKGFVKDFCEELTNVLGYQYEIILPQDQRPGTGGTVRVNSSAGYWNDIYGMLLRNEADLAFGDTEITMERAQNFDFSSPVVNTRFAILYRQSNETSGNVLSTHWAIFSPFPIVVWIPFLVISILYVGFLKFHEYRPNHQKFKSMQKLKYSKKFARVVFLVWMIFLFTSYISNYAAQKVLQATESSEIRPENLVDLVSQKDVKLGWLARGPVERFFRNTVNELYQKIYMQNIGRDWVSSQIEGVNKVINGNGKFALILDSLAADHEKQLDCSLYKLPQEFGPIRPLAVATPIGSPLRERINQAVLALSEQGELEALHARWFSSTRNANGRCTGISKSLKTTATHGSLQEMSPIFIVAVVGLFLSVIIGLLELQLMKKMSPAPQPKPPRQQAELLPKFNLEAV